jgi:hypothetical protein
LFSFILFVTSLFVKIKLAISGSDPLIRCRLP